MLTVACVNVGDYLGRGEEYVDKLRSMVARHMVRPYRFYCLTESGLPGWWSKLGLFLPGMFSGRVLYLDLDSVIVGSLDALAGSKGIIHLRDWGWTKNDYGSSVMVWDAGEHADILERFTPDVMARFRGDQDWLTHLGGWPALPKGLCVSYRYEATKAPPKGASVVQFHGLPKCHDVTSGWVPSYWRL